MKKLYTLTLLIFSAECFSQTPYALFNRTSEMFFNQSNFNLELVGLKPDSVKTIGLDTVYYHYRVFGTAISSSSCSAHAAGWFGTQTRRRSNGDYVFYNKQADSMLLKPLAPLGVSWVYYTYSNGNYIRATVSGIQFGPTFDGQSDSVKTITFQAYSATNTPISDAYNGVSFKIAMNQGVLQIGNMYNFPTNTDIYTRCFGKRLTNAEILDVNVGDTLVSHFYAQLQNPSGYKNDDKIMIFTSKNLINSNTIVYTASVTVVEEGGTMQWTGSTYTFVPNNSDTTSVQTFTVNNANSLCLPHMPGQFYYYQNGGGAYYGNLVQFYFNPVTGNKDCNFRFVYVTGCLMAWGTTDTTMGCGGVSCQSPQRYTYYRKLGLYVDVPPGGQYVTNVPTYYSGTPSKCGTYSITALPENPANGEVQLYPNPVSNILHIKEDVLAAKMQDIQVVDITGRAVLVHRQTISEINVSDLSEGIYFLNFKTAAGRNYTRKFIKID